MSNDTPPAGGWESLHDQGPKIDALAQLLRSAFEAVPPEVQQRCAAALRELLKALRALLEWWIARLERRSPTSGPAEVRDIPVQ